MKQNIIIFITISDKLDFNVSNLELETIISENTNTAFTITKFTILNICEQPVSDLSIYLTKNLEEIDAIIISPERWITCKFKN